MDERRQAANAGADGKRRHPQELRLHRQPCCRSHHRGHCDALEPSIVSNFNPGIDCDAVALWRDCAILYGHWESRLVLADVSDPANPRQIGLYQHEPKTFNQGELEVANGFAYCTGVNSLVIVNIADPANPRLAKAVPFKGAITDVVLRDEYAFVAGNDGIQVLDVTDPANPLAVGHFAQPSFQLAVAVAEPPAPKGDYHIYATSKKRPPVVLRFRAPSGQPPVPGQ